MADLQELLDQAAGPEPPPLSMALLRSQAEKRRRQRRHRRLTAGLAAAALIVAAVVVPRVAARPPDPADSHRIPRVKVRPLPSGRYLGRVADTPVTFTIPPGELWTASRVTADDLLLTEPDVTFAVEVTRWTSVHTYDSHGVALRRTQPVPADLVQWLQGRPGLITVGPVTPTRLAGQPAHLLEIVVSGDYQPRTRPPQGAPQSCGNPANCITLGTTPQGPVVLYAHSFMLLVITDGPAEHRLVAMASIPVNVFDARQASRTALQVLASFSPSP
jgi:hypothetical protein